MTSYSPPAPDGRGVLATFCAAEHLLVSAGGGGSFGHVGVALATLGRERRLALSIQNCAMAPTIIGASNYLCTLPSRFLKRFEEVLDLFEPPLELGSAELAAYWPPGV
jgi:hypothetical protein